MSFRRLLWSVPLVAVLAPVPMALVSTPGYAQVEEIVVTARRREESLQDVPLAITAFSEANIERRGIDDLNDIVKYTPGMTFDEGFSAQDTRVVVRGLSPTRGRPNVAFLQDDVDISSEAIETSGGGLFINPRLFDLERIEVVKGPQSALFGRAAFGGAVHYITKKPGDQFEGRVGIDIGDNGQQEVTASIMGPVVEDGLSLGLNVASWSHDGFYRNTVTGGPVGDSEGVGAAGALVFTPNDVFKATARIEYTDDEFGQQAMASFQADTVYPIPASAYPPPFPPFNGQGVISPGLVSVMQPAGNPPSIDQLVIAHTTNPRTGGTSDLAGVDREIFRANLRLDFDLGWAELSSITHTGRGDSFQETDTQRSGDAFAPTAFTAGIFRIDQDNRLFSEEIRLTSQSEGRFNWVVGGLWWDEDSEATEFNTTCLINPGAPSPFPNCGGYFANEGPSLPRLWDRETQHWSVYGLFDYELNDQWTIHLEARYAQEDLDVTGPTFGSTLGNAFGFPITFLQPPPGQGLTVSGSDDDSYFAPKFFIEYEPNTDLNFYFSVAQAVKPAGISTLGGGPGGFDLEGSRFEAEELTAYEFGAKTLWLDGRLLVNAALYFQDFDEKQTNTQVLVDSDGDGTADQLGTRPVNASKAEILGLEVDAVWSPNENWTFSAGYSYIDSEYKDFRINSSGAGQIAVNGCTQIQPLPGEFTCELDLSGQPIEDVPEHSLFLSAEYQRQLNSDIDWFVQFDANYVDERIESPEYDVIMEEYWEADVRAGLTGENWEVVAYVDNVFDDDTVRTGFLAPDFRTFGVAPFPPPFTVILTNAGYYKLPDPRQWGVRASYRF